MEKEKIEQDLRKYISKETEILMNEPMKKHTSFKIGGPADLYIRVRTVEDLEIIIQYLSKNQIPYYIIGNGSNILIRDKGFRGVILKIDWSEIQIIEEKETKVEVKVSAGVKLSFLAQKLLKNSITGFEFAAGIPGTMGGAVRMNAGAHGGEIKDIIKTVEVLGQDGKRKTLTNAECEFSYRNSRFTKSKEIILSAVLMLKKEDVEESRRKMEEYAKWRKEKQPLEYPNAGSTFKRGDNFITAALIDECGLKGYQIGDAQVSEKHAGFIVNKGNATAEDVIRLVTKVQETVEKKFEKKIELEIEVIGEK
ncbi:MAG TPA: UDP-N-acetylmuramate dehydrogenase [Candidatus Merdicola faecigallinarum]|uniref:UDP-N-acetylenolpyruvoylglucosamine reductase n=1 Tax=Candidatus Merdicola faecigallinarum TaxID=2840862 RepID=A0A9D1M2D8_9FIRM|nr:UDP-N-acetylmuramate dehydrogenase [Candidatus Merdicola faecigallinarum]